MENKDNQRNMILAIVLSVIVLFGSQYLFTPAPAKVNPKNTVNKTENVKNDKKEEKKVEVEKEKISKVAKTNTENTNTGDLTDYSKKEEFITLENKDIKVLFSNYGASLKTFNLKGEKYTLDEDKKSQIFIVKENDKEFYPMSFSIVKDKVEYLKNFAPFEVSEKDKNSIEFIFKNDTFKIVKTYILEGQYSIKLNVKIENISSKTQEFTTTTNYSSFYDHRVEKTNIFGNEGKTFFYKTNVGDFERVDSEDFKNTLSRKDLLLMGIDDRYFISLIKPSYKDTMTFKVNKKVIKKEELEDVRFTFESEPYNLLAGKSVEFSYELYNGPKILKNLEKLGAGDGIDYGIVAVIAQGILWLLLFLYGIFGNYGLALILLTLIVKVALYPLTKSSYASMHKMKKLKPEMDKLKEKYGSDREKIGRETMAMYKKHGVSPLGGCLPMLLQMPIWFGLYRTIQ